MKKNLISDQRTKFGSQYLGLCSFYTTSRSEVFSVVMVRIMKAKIKSNPTFLTKNKSTRKGKRTSVRQEILMSLMQC